jgi:hypothetical protein
MIHKQLLFIQFLWKHPHIGIQILIIKSDYLVGSAFFHKCYAITARQIVGPISFKTLLRKSKRETL